MIKHIVMWRFKEFAEGNDGRTNMLKAKKLLEALEGKVPGMLKIELGINVEKSDMAYDIALYSEFADKKALEAYLEHPDHLAAGEFIGRVRSDRVVVDYEI